MLSSNSLKKKKKKRTKVSNINLFTEACLGPAFVFAAETICLKYNHFLHLHVFVRNYMCSFSSHSFT